MCHNYNLIIGAVDLDQVHLSIVRREPRELKLRLEGIEINDSIKFLHWIPNSLGTFWTSERRT